jgi:hypothetical protein
MTRETITADWLGPLAPLLVSLLVALTSLPSLAGFASGARRGSLAFAGSPRCGLATASPAGAGLSCCPASPTQRAGIPRPQRVRGPRSSASHSSASAG